ncbi:G-protein coupled receptor Mth2-like [Adelges cooleyi]|uniref:G-protein coupled receptor Mth2-like n=1 Tax=Adelges cooleyi TaxID=133065 RepID=UPI00217FBD5C|nr:G-protein coupled receptor Mth2-like [Adelges cooleyi]
MMKIANNGHSDILAMVVVCLLLSTCDVVLAKVALYKCCKRSNEIMVDNNCTRVDERLPPLRVPTANDGQPVYRYHESDTFDVVIGSPCPNGVFPLEPDRYSEDAYRIDGTTGRLFTVNVGDFNPTEYCLERLETNAVSAYPCLPNDTQHVKIDSDEWQMTVYSTTLMLSVPFLIITFLVYACLRELRNLHGKSLMCHVSSLTVAYSFLAFIQVNNPTGNLCIVTAFIIQVSFLASFLWLNVMCFDLWWTFSGFRPLRGNAKRQEAKKFVIYSIYAWGWSIIILIITLYMEFSPTVSPNAIRPEFGKTRCWFSLKTASFLYFYGPIGILLFSNLLMFIYTAVKIVKRMRDAKVLVGSESKKNIDHEKQRFMLYLKLFIVMGINWLTEVISWAFDSSKSVWYVTDIGNTLQGVLIFLIFVCKKRVLKLFKKKLRSTSTQSMRSTTSTRTSTVSKSCLGTKDSMEINIVNKQTSTSDSVSDFQA